MDLKRYICKVRVDGKERIVEVRGLIVEVEEVSDIGERNKEGFMSQWIYSFEVNTLFGHILVKPKTMLVHIA